MKQLDPQGVQAVFAEANQISKMTGSNYYQPGIVMGTEKLLKKTFWR